MLFRKQLGNQGEQSAADFLVKSGFRIIERNFSCPAGEIDLIAQQGRAIIFVEVKTRRSDAAAAPENSITAGKRERMERAARWWLAKRGQPDAVYRFDAVSVTQPEGEAARIRHIVDAFRPRRP